MKIEVLLFLLNDIIKLLFKSIKALKGSERDEAIAKVEVSVKESIDHLDS